MKQKMVKRIMTGAVTLAMAVTSLAVAPTTTANAASYLNLEENTQYVIVSRSSGKALTVEGDSTKAHAKLVQQDLSNKDSQIWTLDYDNGYYYIINKKSGKVLDVPASSTEAGEQIIQDNKGKGNNQKFKISQAGSGYYKIAPKTKSDFSFNVYKNSKNNDGKIVQWPYEGNKNEQWEIREVESKASYRIEAEDMIFVAEDSDADMPKIIKNVPNASGGALVGNLNTENTLVAEFDVEKAGTYCVNVYYASKEVRAFSCLEDPEYPQLCDVTGGWTTVGNEPMTFVVDLEKGENSLSFSTPFYEESMWSPNIDYIEVIKN